MQTIKNIELEKDSLLQEIFIELEQENIKKLEEENINITKRIQNKITAEGYWKRFNRNEKKKSKGRQQRCFRSKSIPRIKILVNGEVLIGACRKYI